MSRPLTCVEGMVGQGQPVVFDADRCYILDKKKTGDRSRTERRNNMYELELVIPPPGGQLLALDRRNETSAPTDEGFDAEADAAAHVAILKRGNSAATNGRHIWLSQLMRNSVPVRQIVVPSCIAGRSRTDGNSLHDHSLDALTTLSMECGFSAALEVTPLFCGKDLKHRWFHGGPALPGKDCGERSCESMVVQL